VGMYNTVPDRISELKDAMWVVSDNYGTVKQHKSTKTTHSQDKGCYNLPRERAGSDCAT
jgi:hypothetical protein